MKKQNNLHQKDCISEKYSNFAADFAPSSKKNGAFTIKSHFINSFFN